MGLHRDPLSLVLIPTLRTSLDPRLISQVSESHMEEGEKLARLRSTEEFLLCKRDLGQLYKE